MNHIFANLLSGFNASGIFVVFSKKCRPNNQMKMA